LAVVAFVAQHFFGVQFSPLTSLKIIQFLILLFVAFAIEYFLALIIVFLGFWFERANGLEQFKWLFYLIIGWFDYSQSLYGPIGCVPS